MKYYLAYGMNTNLASMMLRCPAAVSLGKVVLQGHALTFKLHADAETVNDSEMECALWHITDVCEQSLDALEGYPFYYEKKTVNVEWQGQTVEAMIYYMVDMQRPLERPDQYYLDMLIQGYHQHDMNRTSLYQAYEDTLPLDIIDIQTGK